MSAWIVLTREDDLPDVFNEKEMETLEKAGQVFQDPQAIMDRIIQRVSLEVREAVLNNLANTADDTPYSIPETLANAALDIIAWRMLKRFALTLTDPRQKAYDDAKALLGKVASGDYAIIGPDGGIVLTAGKKPFIVSKPSAFGPISTGLFPTPIRPRRK